MLFSVYHFAGGALTSPSIMLLPQMEEMLPLLDYSPEANCLVAGAPCAACMPALRIAFVWNHWRGRAACLAAHGMRAMCPPHLSAAGGLNRMH